MLRHSYCQLLVLIEDIRITVMKQYTTLIGIISGILTAVSLLPQLIKILKEKKAENISFGMLGVLLAGLIGWICYLSLLHNL